MVTLKYDLCILSSSYFCLTGIVKFPLSSIRSIRSIKIHGNDGLFQVSQPFHVLASCLIAIQVLEAPILICSRGRAVQVAGKLLQFVKNVIQVQYPVAL